MGSVGAEPSARINQRLLINLTVVVWSKWASDVCVHTLHCGYATKWAPHNNQLPKANVAANTPEHGLQFYFYIWNIFLHHNESSQLKCVQFYENCYWLQKWTAGSPFQLVGHWLDRTGENIFAHLLAWFALARPSWGLLAVYYKRKSNHKLPNFLQVLNCKITTHSSLWNCFKTVWVIDNFFANKIFTLMAAASGIMSPCHTHSLVTQHVSIFTLSCPRTWCILFSRRFSCRQIPLKCDRYPLRPKQHCTALRRAGTLGVWENRCCRGQVFWKLASDWSIFQTTERRSYKRNWANFSLPSLRNYHRICIFHH